MHLFAQSFFYTIISEYIWPIHIWNIKITCKTCNEVIKLDFIKECAITNLKVYIQSNIGENYDMLMNLIKNQKAYIIGGSILRCIYGPSEAHKICAINVGIPNSTTIPEHYQTILKDLAPRETTYEYVYKSENGNIHRESITTKSGHHSNNKYIRYIIFYKPTYISINKFFSKAHNINVNRIFLTFMNGKFTLCTKNFNDILNQNMLLKFNTKHNDHDMYNPGNNPIQIVLKKYVGAYPLMITQDQFFTLFGHKGQFVYDTLLNDNDTLMNKWRRNNHYNECDGDTQIDHGLKLEYRNQCFNPNCELKLIVHYHTCIKFYGKLSQFSTLIIRVPYVNNPIFEYHTQILNKPQCEMDMIKEKLCRYNQ